MTKSTQSGGKEEHHVAVTYKAGEKNRALIRKLFGGAAKVSFPAGLRPDKRRQVLSEADVFLSWNLPKELQNGELALAKNIRLLQLLSAGADQVPFAELAPSITIASNVGAYAEPMAEHILAMALALAKNLVREHRNLAKGEFNQAVQNRMLRGLVCGILGFGGIGKATARIMRAIGMRIHAVNTTGTTSEDVEFIGTLDDLERVLSDSDVAVISLPLTKKTRGLIGKRQLGWMKKNAILINVARGDILDEGALYEHLRKNPDFQAGIDAWWVEPFKFGVFATNYPFLDMPNVVGSPHNSGIVPGMNEEGTRRAVENVNRYFRGETLAGVVRREDYL